MQRHIVRLCGEAAAASARARKLVLFKTREFRTPEAVVAALAEHGGAYRHTGTRAVAMQGSGEGKTAWVFQSPP